MKNARILLVDADLPASALLARYLARFDMRATAVADAEAMQAQLAQEPVDLVVLSHALGLDVMQALRRHSDIPLILLTKRGEAADRIIGLETGADDCMTLPPEPRELVARIQVVLRRAARGRPSSIDDSVTRFDGWQLDRDDRRLTSPAGLRVPLSNAEYQLLTTFLTQPRQVLSRDQLATRAQGKPAGSVARSIDLLVSRLRQKLAADEPATAMIRTVRGDGYTLDARSVR